MKTALRQQSFHICVADVGLSRKFHKLGIHSLLIAISSKKLISIYFPPLTRIDPPQMAPVVDQTGVDAVVVVGDGRA